MVYKGTTAADESQNPRLPEDKLVPEDQKDKDVLKHLEEDDDNKYKDILVDKFFDPERDYRVDVDRDPEDSSLKIEISKEVDSLGNAVSENESDVEIKESSGEVVLEWNFPFQPGGFTGLENYTEDRKVFRKGRSESLYNLLRATKGHGLDDKEMRKSVGRFYINSEVPFDEIDYFEERLTETLRDIS